MVYVADVTVRFKGMIDRRYFGSVLKCGLFYFIVTITCDHNLCLGLYCPITNSLDVVLLSLLNIFNESILIKKIKTFYFYKNTFRSP